jgi:hypothetical protein
LVYVKPSFTGDEGRLLRYRDQEAAFPFDPTYDQMFDAARFSAYVELGRHCGEALVGRLVELYASVMNLGGPVRVPGARSPNRIPVEHAELDEAKILEFRRLVADLLGVPLDQLAATLDVEDLGQLVAALSFDRDYPARGGDKAPSTNHSHATEFSDDGERIPQDSAATPRSVQ